MLIHRSQLFTSGADPELLKMYLAHTINLGPEGLVDGCGTEEKNYGWQMDVLDRKMSAEARQALAEALINDPVTFAAAPAMRSLNDDQLSAMYRWALGLRREQSISLDNVLANIDDGQYGSTLTALSGRVSENWFLLKELISKLPVPKEDMKDLNQLIWQVRSIFADDDAGASGIRQLFIKGELYQFLVSNADSEMITRLEDDLRTSVLTSRDGAQYYINLHRHLATYSLRNPNISESLKNHFFDALLSGEYGDLNSKDLTALLKSEQIPDAYFTRLVDCLIDRWEAGNTISRKVHISHEAQFNEFLQDERLDCQRRDKLLGLCYDVMHDYLMLANESYKHARDLTSEEVAFVLARCTNNVIVAGGPNRNYQVLGESFTKGSKEFLQLKERIVNHQLELIALTVNNMLSDEQIHQLMNVFMLVNTPSMVNVFIKNRNMPKRVVEGLAGLIKERHDDPDKTGMESGMFLKKLCQLMLNQNEAPQDLLKAFLEKYMVDLSLRMDMDNKIDTIVAPLNIPVSVNGLLLAIDYESGYAFKLIDHFLKDKVHFHLDLDAPRNTADVNILGSLVKLAMTREVYPALLNDKPLDNSLLNQTLALAVRDCDLDGFDIKVISSINSSEQFKVVADILFGNPLFEAKHPEAYEALTAEVLKRKTAAMCAEPIAFKPSRHQL
jgi:hypothetical protein